MRKSSMSLRTTPLARALLGGVLIAFMIGCARSSRMSDAEPEEAPPGPQVKASDLTSNRVEKRPHEPVESLLKGRVAGVRVSLNPDGSISVRIRGASSFLASNEPLYVLDGTPIRPGPGGALTGINPYDIESIEVLKYPPETSLYGVRGANGVILIKTKNRPK